MLMQRPKQEGLGAAFGGGITDQVWGAQTTNVLQKATVFLAVTFFVITLILSVLVSKNKNMANNLSLLRLNKQRSDPPQPTMNLQ